MQLLPANGTFSAPGSFDIKGSGRRTLYAWGDFAGGKITVQAVVPHADGDEVFEAEHEVQLAVPLDDDSPDEYVDGAVKEFTSRGFMTFEFTSPLVRISLLGCDDTPDVKYWVG